MSERKSPHNLEAERSVLGAPLLDPEKIHDILDLLRADDFYLPAHREIYEAMAALQKRDRPIDVVLLADELTARSAIPKLEGGEAYLMRLAEESPTAENVRHYARLVKDAARKRALLRICGETMARLYGELDEEGGIDAAEALEREVFRLNLQQSSRDRPYESYLDEAVAEVQIASQLPPGELPGIPTGNTELDELIGGWRRQNLYVIGGRPGMGKSGVLINSFAIDAAYKFRIPTLIFTLEMTGVELARRHLSQQARISGTKLERGTLDKSEWSRLYKSVQELRPAPLEVKDQGGMRIAEIAARARRFRADTRYFPKDEEKPKGLLVLDYLQLAKGGGESDSREQEVAEISRSLKALAKETGLAVIAASQIGRQAEKVERPRLGDLRESGAIESDADVVILLYRGEYYKDASSEKGTIELIVAKNRHGRTNTVMAKWIGELARMENYEPT